MLRKNILIVISEKKNNEEFKKWVEKIFHSENLDIFIFDSGEKKIDAKLVTSDYIVNFLDEKKDYEYVQKKIELLKLDYFGNKCSDIKLFSEKNNFKKIIEQSNFNTPIFEKIKNRNSLELFNNFPQPSRIFSKENNFFSEKNDTLEKIDNILSVQKNIDNYFIEEFIEGEEIYGFSFLSEDGVKVFIARNKNGNWERIEKNINIIIENKIKEFLEYSEIKEFALFNMMYSEKRGLYFLNIFLKNSILFKYESILNRILSLHDNKDLEKILKKDLF